MTALRQLLRRFDALFDRPEDVRALALLRILVGPIVIYHLWPFIEEMWRGRYYADYFYAPWATWVPVAPRPLYFVMLALAPVSACLMSLGYKTRWSTGYTAFFVTYNFFSSETLFRHNRNFLVLVLLMLALVPAGRTLSFDARRRATPLETRASLWPMYLMRFEVVCVYSASAISKLLNPDWRSGLVLLTRSRWYEPKLRSTILPDFVVDLVTHATFHSCFAKFAIASELSIAILLLSRRTRYAGAFLAVSFHAIIEIALSVQIFSYLAIGGLLIWTTPVVRDRVLVFDPTNPQAARSIRWIERLDWLARFRIEAASAPAAESLRLVDRDGSQYQGRRALRRAFLRCPLTFIFVAPLVLRDNLRAPVKVAGSLDAVAQ